MIKRIFKSRLPLIVYHPLKVYSLDYFRGIHNSGGLPVLDTEFFDLKTITRILEELKNESILFGIRIFVTNQKLIDFISQNYFFNLDVIIFSYYKIDHLSYFKFNNKEYKIFIETTDIKINDQIDTICPHGLIVKGYEAPGKISKYTSFVLMQWYLKNSPYPVFVHGGVGMFTAPGMFAAGVNGVVLDNQLYLSKEAPLSENYKDLIAKLDESDSTVIGQALETPYRFFSKLGTKITKEFKEKESHLAEQDDADRILYSEIRKSISALDNKDDNPMQSLFYLGQDAFFAKNFNKMVNKKEKFAPLKDIINTFFEYISVLLNEIDDYDPLKADSPLAKEHGTKYPVVQGPMGNISDNATFAAKIYENGALPFFALGNFPPELTDKILTEGNEKVKTYGAGLIGVETINQSINSHIEQVKKHKSPFALFAGGVPSQVNELESHGIKTYLHTPSVSMLDNAIESGCKRFIFEGTEAGGHIGSQTSLVLWETSINKIVSENNNKINELRLLFAGGISTRFASFFISGMTSLLAKKGAKIGIQVGTIYLFTEEILATGAINKLYQDVISEADETIVAGRTVGLTSRTVRTPLTEKLIREEHQRVKDGIPLSERKHLFESENIGSLLIAAKAFAPKFTKKEDGKTKVTLVPHNEKEQYEKGNFMIGDSLAFESSSLTIPEIHKRYFDEKKELFDHLNAIEIFSNTENLVSDEIAIIGMGCIYPDANNTDAFWQNILSKKYSIKEPPKDRFNSELYFDEDRKAEDKSYSKIAGVIDDFEFNAERFGYTEEKAAKLSRSQKMVLEAAYQAVEDAGYLDDNNLLKEDFRKKTAVIIGSCLTNELSNNCHLKYYYPEMRYYLDQIKAFRNLSEKQKENLLENLKERVSAGIKYEPVHGSIINIEASRIAYHLGIEGINFTVDAACATSFTTIDCGINELLSGNHDLSIVGGINSNLAPEPFIGFSKMGALSNDGSFPFDERANGFVLGEGTGVLILKRMKDAIRDNDKIYGVIKAVGSSSDGKGKAIAAPNPLGQAFALKRCFEKIKTDVSYSDIDYIEAHGTATIMGDQAEIEALKNVYKSNTPIGVSSIKSQIGHLLGGAGCAGLIKALLAIKNKTLPPNGKFEKISSNFSMENTPLYIIKDPAEWKVKDGKSRKAAVSSYGFGGINYHCVIEEYTENYKILQRKIFPDMEYDFNDDRIVVAGLGIMAPGAKNVYEFWKNLVECNDVVSEIPESRFHNKYYEMEDDESDFKVPLVKAGIIKDYKFNNSKFRVPPFTVKSIDRAQQFCIEAADQAIEQSKLIPLLQEKGNKTAVILGVIPGEFYVENILRNRIPFLKQVIDETENIDKEILEKISDQFVDALKDRYLENTEDTIPGLLSNIISGRIANYYNCNGANFVVDASCASSAIAIRAGVNGLLSKDYDFVITGGADANLYPAVLLAFKRLGLLSDNECSFFDTNSKGYIMSEGSAIQVLTTYKNAVKNNMTIIGEIDAVHFSSSVPNHLLSPSEQVFTQTIDECFKKSSVNKNQISHLDVFGFANYFLDFVEKQAIEASFDSETFFGNAKHQFGYFKGANPAIVLTKLMLMIKNRAILPNFCYKPETSIIDEKSILSANTELLDVSKRHSLYMASNVNGIGGNHGHMIVGRIPEYLEKRKQVQHDISVIPKRKSLLGIMKKTYNNESKEEYNIPETLIQEKGKQKIVALLSGQGAQHSGMMKELYDTHKVIKRLMDQGNEIFINESGYSLLDMMFGKDDSLNLTENTQPAIFLSTAAIYKLLNEKGLKPDCFIGHSVGEYSALYCCGVLSFENAMKLIIKRCDFMKQAAENTPGRIIVVFKNAKDTLSLIRESEIPDIYVANKNSQRQTAVSGAKQEIEKFCEYLSENSQMFTRLKLSGAFHSPLFRTAAESLNEYINSIYFNDVDYSRIISNVTGKPYPKDIQSIKELLVKQITSPVEFIKSIENVYESGRTHFIEIGPSRLLSNLLKHINIVNYHSLPSVDIKKGQVNTLNLLCDHLEKYNKNFAYKTPVIPKPVVSKKPQAPDRSFENNKNFEKFKERNTELMNDIMYQEFIKHEKYAAYDKFDFYTGKVNISGVSIGLPGKGKRVFASDNFDKLIDGTNFIESLPQLEKEKIADKNVTRLFKQPDGNAKFVEITSPEDVVQLAGQLGYFDIHDEYGIKAKYDYSMELAMAAGIEALKDANIPLVMRYKETSSGSRIPDGFALPVEMQDNTGVIITSLFPSSETLIEEMTRYYYNKFYIKPYEEFENIYYHIMQSSVAKEIKDQVTDWFLKIKGRRKEFSTFKFDRDFIANVCPLGAAHLAQLIKARGPNVFASGACASTTQAVGIAEDWIRSRRCDRVIIIGGENATSPLQNQWIGTSFLAIGAVTVKKYVEEAAKPFDEDRNGTILGAGAVSLVVEREDMIKERGMNGQAQVLGVYLGNSAYHPYNIDVNHLASELGKFIEKIEYLHDLDKNEYVPKLVFMSHETFTPARGGSADAEIKALRDTFPDHYKDIVISNTKGYTGHTLGAGIEDAVLVKAMQKGAAPPIPNLKKIPENFRDLNLNKNMHGDYQYGLHLAAGFGSHFAFILLKRVEENKISGNEAYKAWLTSVSGDPDPKVSIIDNTLCIEPISNAINENKPVRKPVPEVAVEKKLSVSPSVSIPLENFPGTIKKIISEQTGYTVDMLEDDLDLEADLGIDTVKQVEIFGKISALYKLRVPEDLKLNELNTIGKLEEYISNSVSVEEKKKADQKIDVLAPAQKTGLEEKPIKRLIVRVKETKVPEISKYDFNDKTILLTKDNFGFSDKISELIKAKNGNVITIGEDDKADIKLDLADVKAVEENFEKIKKDYPDLNGLLHLAPLNFYFDRKETDDKELNTSIKSLFLMIKGLYDTLDKQGSLIATLSFDSVIFPYFKNSKSEIFPTFAGISGMLKTVNKEMPDTRVKIVDFSVKNPLKQIGDISKTFLNELLSEDKSTETGYRDNKKYHLVLRERKIEKGDSIVKEEDVILVTGGAGGITFELLKKLARTYKVKFIIFDINDISQIDEKFLTKEADNAFILNELKNTMKGSKPLEIKAAVDSTFRVKQTIDNLNHLRSLGAEVEYNCVDVTKYDIVRKIIKKYDKIDGILHAAGLEQSQLIAKKEFSSFNIVVDVKVKGILNILKAVRNIDYRFFLTFSSVTARFGNEGQVDYTSANDMIGKVLLNERKNNPDRFYKVYAWTAWLGAGMATKETVQKVLESRGITFLPLDQGIQFFMDDLFECVEPEAVFSGLDFTFDVDGIFENPYDTDYPFLDKEIEKDGKKVTYLRVLDLSRDRFLLDHSMEGTPLFLGSTGVETMAEIASRINGDKKYLVELKDFSIPYGIKILKQRPKEIVIKAKKDESSEGLFHCDITSVFRNPKGIVMGDPTIHYQGTYVFSDTPLDEVKIELPEFVPVYYEGEAKDIIYNPKRLFMEGLFETIKDFASFNNDLLITKIKDTSLKDFFSGVKNPRFKTDAVIIDAMFQTGGLFEFLGTNFLVLPYKIKSMKFIKPPVKGDDYLCMTRKTAIGDETITFQLDLVDPEGNLFIKVENFQMVKLSKLEKEYRILDRIKAKK